VARSKEGGRGAQAGCAVAVRVTRDRALQGAQAWTLTYHASPGAHSHPSTEELQDVWEAGN
jgi:hypothetical protein